MERLRRWAYYLMERREEEDDGNLLKVIPPDLIIEILLRLPAKSVVRFRCVSKLCSSITTRPDFIKTFAARSSPRTCILVDAKTKGFISLPRHEDEASRDVYTIPTDHPIFGYSLRGSESVHGLVCLAYPHGFIVWNPTLRQHVALPNPVPRVRYICSGFGYDPIEDKYKVLCIPSNWLKDYTLVFTLGPQESWRRIQNSPSHFTAGEGQLGTCINGHVYYPAALPCKLVNGFYGPQERMLVSFDVRYETFSTIRKPADDTLNDYCMFNYEGKLAWGCLRFTIVSRFRFWVLEDEEKQEWSLREFLFPFPTDPKWNVILRLLDITHDTGEFVYMKEESRTNDVWYYDIKRTYHVWYYDPKRNLTRRIKYERVVDDFGDLSWTMVHYYPNHTESLMSLDNMLLENVPGYYHGYAGSISDNESSSDDSENSGDPDDSSFRDKHKVSCLLRTCPRRSLLAIILVLVAFFLSMISRQVIQ